MNVSTPSTSHTNFSHSANDVKQKDSPITELTKACLVSQTPPTVGSKEASTVERRKTFQEINEKSLIACLATSEMLKLEPNVFNFIFTLSLKKEKRDEQWLHERLGANSQKKISGNDKIVLSKIISNAKLFHDFRIGFNKLILGFLSRPEVKGQISKDVILAVLSNNIKIINLAISISKKDNDGLEIYPQFELIKDALTGATFIILMNAQKSGNQNFIDYREKYTKIIKKAELMVANIYGKKLDALRIESSTTGKEVVVEESFKSQVLNTYRELIKSLMDSNKIGTVFNELLRSKVGFVQLSDAFSGNKKQSIVITSEEVLTLNEKAAEMSNHVPFKEGPVVEVKKNKKEKIAKVDDETNSPANIKNVDKSMSVVIKNSTNFQLQMSWLEPDSAMHKKINEIIQDLCNGVDTFHYWNGHCFADLTSEEQGKGRGKYRLAFHRGTEKSWVMDEIYVHKGNGFVFWSGK
ncbi:hypothetical protein AAF463_23620 (plasmid) [Pantoea sp. BJ2]|uniref:Uncharacterized protein n=1 Tax=Pantoea sp. BJ2 TaxID=3141322 RepID=A0AAU7U4D1_9GAMM